MVKVLLEFPARQQSAQESAFSMNEAAVASRSEAERQSATFLDDLSGMGVVLEAQAVPVPMMIGPEDAEAPGGLTTLATGPSAAVRKETIARTVVVPAEVPEESLAAVASQPGVTVWPNSELTLLDVDCAFSIVADIEKLQELLDVAPVWKAGHRGAGIVVGIIDEGVNGATYPVDGGFTHPSTGRTPGDAPVTSHGSMCAADVLVAAPDARLYDYPFLGVPNSGGALQMFQAVLNQRSIDGTPHLTNNSYGFTGVPNPAVFPHHEIHDSNHPLHRKVREVVAAGVPCFFAAGNCGAQCPSGNCHPSGVGPGISIHASNSLAEVITVAAVNSEHERIGYSSQGPGMFEAQKPDIAAYSHFFGNFGPGRPGGGTFDNGTSAATPVAAGVGALLMSAFPSITPAALKDVLVRTALPVGNPGWNADTGNGIVNAGAAFADLSAAAKTS